MLPVLEAGGVGERSDGGSGGGCGGGGDSSCAGGGGATGASGRHESGGDRDADDSAQAFSRVAVPPENILIAGPLRVRAEHGIVGMRPWILRCVAPQGARDGCGGQHELSTPW